MDNGYIVRFIRKDRKPEEQYFYHSYTDAVTHLEMFRDDDSGLFKRVEIIDSRSLRLPYAVLELQDEDCFEQIYN